ncbi:transcriptional regulator, LysR family [Rhizobiales bacterium GAS191]|jgi:DNA-binding transcriptional LysR family regulator|nr:DNA-binding transcriptional regulator, LysR family [Rhizobiales bacterium GAS113]SEC46416.1 DNA-binding transcriptional regulator, LysR family [Rhizobiales bacterium GAS188]SEC81303.1 transcriptional regulator, LysR family [Rhizobiales bacterium GAS191]
MRSLNLDQLQTLAEVAALGSFSAAARRLNLTQPAISLQIRDLERRFGVRLIERMGREAHATPPGRDLVEHARRIFQECDVAMSTMRRYRDGWLGRVHIGTTLTALMYELPPIIRELRADFPGIDLVVTNMTTRDTVENILQNKLDLGLVTLPVEHPRLRITPLRLEKLVAILPAGTRDVPDVITPDYVAQQSLVLEHERGAVYALVMQWLSKQMPLPRAPMHMGTVEAAKLSVALDLGMSIVPDVAVAQPMPDVIVRPLQPPLPCTLALIEHSSKPNEPALEIVRNALLELRADLGTGSM